MRPGIDRPLTILIGALGGEGGGVLADWIVEAATSAGMLVQSTSIPGVAQRTGATTYYLEMVRADDGHAAEPVFGLYPAPGYVDVVMTTELLEAGRAIERGFVTPGLTTLISSSHRIPAIAERSAMGDGAFDGSRILEAAQRLSGHAVIVDFDELARTTGLALNAMLLGAFADCGVCPIPPEAFEKAIATQGIAVDSNVKAFRAGRQAVSDRGKVAARSGAEAADLLVGAGRPHLSGLGSLEGIVPAPVRDLIAAGVQRLTDYHDKSYADLYLARLGRLIEIDRSHPRTGGFALTMQAARYLALWMAYEDVIRVADLKTRRSRLEAIRREIRAKADEPVRVTEFLKPGLEEAATVLPARLAGRLVRWAERRKVADKLHVALRIRTDTILGYGLMRMLAGFKWVRRRGYRYAVEQALIERWIDAVEKGARRKYRLGIAIAGLGRLIKGYSDTRVRAFASFNRIFERLVDPALAGVIAPDIAVRWIEEAQTAALADEQGLTLQRVLEKEPEPAEAPAHDSPLEHRLASAHEWITSTREGVR